MPELRVRRDDLATFELAEGEGPRTDLADGEAQLRVERFALSSNNITYAVLGDAFGYWGIFPADEGWGRIPAWGYSRVVASRSPDLAEGDRVFGLVPMGTHFTVRPATGRSGFADASPHRERFAPVYNHYLPVAGEGDDAALVMRPLFGTSLLLDLTLADDGLAGAETVVLTSASSKTAYGLAHLLASRPVQTVGLTSPERVEWVDGLGLYDTVLGYDEIRSVFPAGGAVIVDFAGDAAVLHALHRHLDAALTRSIRVGVTHWEAAPGEAPLPGPAPELFFAPDEMVRRGRDLGTAYAAAWEGFAPVAARAMRISRVVDGDGLVRVYGDLLAGRADPAVGFVASL